MELTVLADSCPDGRTCPKLFKTDRGTIVVQGYTLAADDLDQVTLGEGETAVEIPAALLEEAIRAYGR